MTIRQLKETQGALAKQMLALNDNNKGAAWTAEVQGQWDALMADHDRVDAEITRREKLERIVIDDPAPAPVAMQSPAAVDEKAQSRGLFHAWVRDGYKGMSAEQLRSISAAMSTTTPAEGGHTVPTVVATEILDALRAYGAMRNVATVIRTAGGNPMNYPTSDGTAEVGEIIAENQTATELDLTFGVVTLTTFKYSSRVVPVPFELLQDTAVDLEGYIRARLVERLGRITENHFTSGTGSGQPWGIVTRATLGKTGANGQTTSIVYDDLVDLEHSVDPAYRRNARFMLADSSVRILKRMKDADNRPIWLPGYDAGLAGGAPQTILGYPYVVNQAMAAMAANARSVLFGDLSRYVIRDVMDVTMFRFTDSPYTIKGQVAFLAWMRSTGNLLDTAAVKCYANSAT